MHCRKVLLTDLNINCELKCISINIYFSIFFIQRTGISKLFYLGNHNERKNEFTSIVKMREIVGTCDQLLQASEIGS